MLTFSPWIKIAVFPCWMQFFLVELGCWSSYYGNWFSRMKLVKWDGSWQSQLLGNCRLDRCAGQPQERKVVTGLHDRKLKSRTLNVLKSLVVQVIWKWQRFKLKRKRVRGCDGLRYALCKDTENMKSQSDKTIAIMQFFGVYNFVHTLTHRCLSNHQKAGNHSDWDPCPESFQLRSMWLQIPYENQSKNRVNI